MRLKTEEQEEEDHDQKVSETGSGEINQIKSIQKATEHLRTTIEILWNNALHQTSTVCCGATRFEAKLQVTAL